MISVVICSINADFARQVKRNIDETIGVPVEVILIDNAILKKSISEVYNMGAAQAKYDIICFVHEDVLFRTNHWGQIIVSLFQQHPTLGLVGLAGAKYKSRTFSGWSTNNKALDCVNILHLDPHGNEQLFSVNPQPGSKQQEVVVIDGVFMCTTRKVWQQFPHNEALITGFHLYDIDFSFAISEQYKVLVTYEIDLTHLTTGGSYGDNWLEHTINWHRHHKNKLPRSILPAAQLPGRIEATIRKSWMHRLRTEKISWANKFKWIFGSGIITDPYYWPYAGLFFFYRIFNKK